MRPDHDPAGGAAEHPAEVRRPRGRPPTITRERIIAAGAVIGLPGLTVAGVADKLGVTQAALYKHVTGVEELRTMVAEAVFTNWKLPPADARQTGLADYLEEFSDSLRGLVHEHPGIVPFLARRAPATPAMAATILSHHDEVSAAFGLDREVTRWLLSTVAFVCVALADTVYSTYLPSVRATPGSSGPPQDEVEREFRWGMRAQIIGALAVAGIDAAPTGRWRLEIGGPGL